MEGLGLLMEPTEMFGFPSLGVPKPVPGAENDTCASPAAQWGRLDLAQGNKSRSRANCRPSRKGGSILCL
jgi:hypothetical protein